MTITELAQEICKREGGKNELNIADVNEVLRCLGDIMYENRNGTALAMKLESLAQVRAEKHKQSVMDLD